MPEIDNIATSGEICRIDLRLKELTNEIKKLTKQREHLEQELSLPQKDPASFSTEQKVSVFKKLFRGRAEIFAQRWGNSKGRSGYSVACHNEWKTGLCHKPKIKCTECSNKKFKALNNQAIYDHLAGKQTIGLYPLLTDDSCHLLAVDFDKKDWQAAISAMMKACQQFNISHAVEISRSGNGAHLWIFFSEPVTAKDARQLGFGLLDKAMEIHPNLSFDSYDRLFPNQDIMPEGGFGNLIALPLQYQARQLNRCVFVDTELTPYIDQWSFLSRIKTLNNQQLKDLLIKITLKNQLPWEQGAKEKQIIISHCPASVTLVLANHIYVKTDELPSSLIARLKFLASFSNPVFFKTQASDSQHMAFPDTSPVPKLNRDIYHFREVALMM